MDYRIIFSQRLLQCRKRVGVSQKALAEYVGVSDAAIAMLENAKRAPSFELLCAITDYFNVPIDYLVGRSDVPQTTQK